MIRRLTLALLLPLLLACDERAALRYADYDTPVACDVLPELCGLPLTDLGGGDHPNAWHLVFIGDGYCGDVLRFQLRVQQYVEDLQREREGFVTWDPELFHFWRVDLGSYTAHVNDDVHNDTPLAAHLSPTDSCAGGDFLEVHDGRAELAVRNALLASEDGPQAALAEKELVLVSVVRDAIGRANASSGRVRISDLDDTHVLRHELGHAMFDLGDEYVEFDACPAKLPEDYVCRGPCPDASEEALLATPNLTRADDAAKWGGATPEVTEGGGRWPCLFHPTSSCLMEGSHEGFCPVCEGAIRERIAMRRCEDDALAPRVALSDGVALVPGGGALLLAASAFDERDAPDLGWQLDGEALDVEGPFLSLPLAQAALEEAGLAGAREVRATATDARGNRGVSPPRALSQHLLEITDVVLSAEFGPGRVAALVRGRPDEARLDLSLWEDGQERYARTARFQGRYGTWFVLPALGAPGHVELRLTLVSVDGSARGAPWVVPPDALAEVLAEVPAPQPAEVLGLRAGLVPLSPVEEGAEPVAFLPERLPFRVGLAGCRAPVVDVAVFAGDELVGRGASHVFPDNMSCVPDYEEDVWVDVDFSSLLPSGGDKVELTVRALDVLGEVSERRFAAQVGLPEGCETEVSVDTPPESKLGRLDPAHLAVSAAGSLYDVWAWHAPSGSPVPLIGDLEQGLWLYPIDVPGHGTGEPETVHVLTQSTCGALWAVDRVELALRRDTEPPALVAPSARYDGEPLQVFAEDDQRVARVTATLPSGAVQVDEERPYTFDVEGPVLLTAVDEAGNTTERPLTVTRLPVPRTFCEEAR